MSDAVFVYIGTYASADAAKGDLAVVHDHYADDTERTYDAAIVTKEADGKVHVRRHEERTSRAAWNGAGVGALVGLLTPHGIVHSTTIGAATAALVDHFRHGLSRHELKQLGDRLEAGEASLVVVSTAEFDDALTTRLQPVEHTIERLGNTDAKEFARELQRISAD